MGNRFPGGDNSGPAGWGGSTGATGTPGWGSGRGSSAPQMGGPFERGKSPAEQRTDSHDQVAIGLAVFGAGVALVGIALGPAIAAGAATVSVAAAATGAVGGAMIGWGFGHAGTYADKTKDAPNTATGSDSSSAGGVPEIEADAGGEQTEEVPIVEEGDASGGKPDPNDPNGGRPDPNSYRPAPDDSGGGPRSTVADFPHSFDYYPDPNGGDSVGPRAAGARLRDVPVALGNGMQAAVRQLGPKSFRLAP